MPQVQIDPRFHGPPHSANGGYACGLVAGLTDTPVAVSLHVPPPLGTPMEGERTPDGGASLRLGDTLVARATPVGPVELTVPAAVSPEQARDAQDRFVGFDEHPFPTCWVCGPRRPAGDGLQVFPGLVPDAPVDGLVAATWTPHDDVGDDQGHVVPEHVWAALDCPSYFGCVVDEPALLARLSTHLAAPVRIGEPHVVLGWRTEAPDGRKRHGASAVLDADGRVLASSRALWVTLSAEALAAILEPS